jgi:hypothetical protein
MSQTSCRILPPPPADDPRSYIFPNGHRNLTPSQGAVVSTASISRVSSSFNADSSAGFGLLLPVVRHV